jgi:transcriptional regulator with XRE-family HTH domain
MPLENKVVSSQEVALAAGVSRTVVSWVVNGTAAQHRVTKATEQRVKAAVAQLNYEPSRFLRGKELLSESPAGSLSSTTKQPNNPTTDFLRTRVRRLRDFQAKVDSTWNNPIVKLMLK